MTHGTWLVSFVHFRKSGRTFAERDLPHFFLHFFRQRRATSCFAFALYNMRIPWTEPTVLQSFSHTLTVLLFVLETYFVCWGRNELKFGRRFELASSLAVSCSEPCWKAVMWSLWFCTSTKPLHEFSRSRRSDCLAAWSCMIGRISAVSQRFCCCCHTHSSAATHSWVPMHHHCLESGFFLVVLGCFHSERLQISWTNVRKSTCRSWTDRDRRVHLDKKAMPLRRLNVYFSKGRLLWWKICLGN